METAQKRILHAEKEAALVDRARAALELEKQRISQLIDILSDFSTQACLPHLCSILRLHSKCSQNTSVLGRTRQATFLAGVALAAVGGESLESASDQQGPLYQVGAFLFVGFGALAVGRKVAPPVKMTSHDGLTHGLCCQLHVGGLHSVPLDRPHPRRLPAAQDQ